MTLLPDPNLAKVPLLASDFRRLLFSAAIGTASTLVAAALYVGASGGDLTADAIIVGIYIFSAMSSLAFFVTTFAVFQDADANTLARWLAGTAPTGRLSKVQASVAGTGPNIPAPWSG